MKLAADPSLELFVRDIATALSTLSESDVVSKAFRGFGHREPKEK